MKDLNKKNKEGFLSTIKDSFSGRNFKSGVYVSIVSAIVILVVVLVNLIISEFDLKIDLSTQKFYTLTDQTREYISKIEDDVTVYYLAETGNEFEMYQKIAEKFDSLSDKITLEHKDPIQYPNFTKEYVDDEVSLNSFLVVNNNTKQARYVSGNDMLITEFDQSTYQFYPIGVDVEGKLISAIQYVTNADLPVIYYTAGHEENEVGSAYKGIMDRMNITIEPIQTLIAREIPDDCNILLINAPKKDFTNEEMEMIKSYMAAGGNAIITVDHKAQKLDNLNSLINYYGLQLEEGIVIEGDADNYIPMYPRYIVPTLLRHDITYGLFNSDNLVVIPQATGLTIRDNVRSSLTIEPLMETSDKAYSKVNISSDTLLKEDGDIDGPFYLGLVSSDTYNGTTSKMIIYASGVVFDDTMLSQAGNYYLLVTTIGNLIGEIETISVRPRYFASESLNITQKAVMSWGALTVIVIPVIIMAVGIVINVKRRKR